MRPPEPQEQSPNRNGALAAALAAIPELPSPPSLLTGGLPPPGLSPQRRRRRFLGVGWGGCSPPPDEGGGVLWERCQRRCQRAVSVGVSFLGFWGLAPTE
eukprot:1461046-Alexandrium_andersonii.AAC.1